MSNSLLKDTLRAVKKNFSRYISIMLIVALGMAFFVGIKATAPDMFTTAEKYFTDYNLMDLRIQSNIGLTDADVEAVKSIPGIEYAAGEKFADALVRVNGEIESDIDGTQISTRAYSISPENISNYLSGINDGSYINRVQLIEGRFPTSAGECLVDASRLSTPDSYTLGSVITLEGDKNNLSSSLSVSEFTIVGIIRTPYYLSFERGNTNIGSGKIGTFIYIPDEAFSSDYYSEMYIKVVGSENYDPFSDEYFEFVQQYTDDISNISAGQLSIRVASLSVSLAKEIADGKKTMQEQSSGATQQIEELKETIKTLEELVKNGAQILADAQKEFDDKFADAENTLSDNSASYNAALKEYEQKLSQYEDANAEYKNKLAEYNSKKNSYDKVYTEWKSADSKLSTIKTALDTTQSLITAGESVLQRIQDTQTDAYNNEQIQAIISAMQTTYPELYNSVKALTTSGLASEIATTLDPYITQQKETLATQQKSINEQVEVLNAIEKNLKEQETLLTNATTALTATKEALDKANSDLNKMYSQLSAAGIDIKSGELELEIERIKAQNDLDNLSDNVKNAGSNLLIAQAKLTEADSQLDGALAEANEKINYAEDMLDRLTIAQWNIYDRNGTPGYAGYGQSVNNIKVLANIFPIFFFLISSMICLTTMTRMIEEDRILLGTYKALGYTSGSLIAKYSIYSVSACLFGSIIGIVVAVLLFPNAINSAYGIMYTLPTLINKFPWIYALIGFIISLACTALTTIFSLFSELKTNPAVLMRAKAPKAGKRILLERIGFIWKRLNFSAKVTMRNLFRNKQRFFMTMLGIAGCTALLLASLGMYNSIKAISVKQYGDTAISEYDFQLVFDEAQKSADSSAEYISASSDSRVQSLLMTSMKSMTGFSERSSKKLDVYVLVPENIEALSDYVDLRNRKSGEAYTLTDDGAIITEKLAKDTKTSVGDTICFSDSSGNTYSVKVSAITENYTFHYIYISPAVYASVTGTQPSYGYAMGKISTSIKEATSSSLENVKGLLATDLMKIDGVVAVAYTSDTTEAIGKITDALSLVILLFFVSALILAFVVLYNLSNINIIERTRELATLKVLGFVDKEVSSYIYRENIIVSVFGIVTGLLLGVGLHYLLITFTAIDTVMYGQDISPYSFLISIGITVLFILIINLIMHRKLKKVDMVLSLKSVE